MNIYKAAVCSVFAAATIANAVDALGGDGMFYSNFDVPSSWSLNVKGGAATGAIEGEYDGDLNYVLKFWSNGVAYYDYYIQALHTVPVQKGYSYQIEATGYYFYNDETGETNYGASIGLQSKDGTIQYLSDYLKFDYETATYTSKVYKHCDANDATANIYINAGQTVGDFTDGLTYFDGAGFSIMSVKVNKTAITCGNDTPTSSASTPRSSASTQPTGNGKGPVSQYGQLQTGTNSAGQGRIYGSCPTWSVSGKEVQVKGMSLFWSINPTSAAFWNADVVTRMVQDHNIQLIRAAMGVDESWGSGNYFTKESYYQGLMDEVVQAAIDNDIYVIIDYHSHKAHEDVASAQAFFSRMASKWGSYDNVIFEIFNEPACITGGSGDCETASFGGGFLSWSSIRTYANKVIATIRDYSDNLIIVGTPMWDQQPNAAIGAEVTDPANNTAYAFHYYAGSHTTGSQGANAEEAMEAGLSVFVSEWGTINADGKGGVASANTGWQTWMNKFKLSSANWSLTSLVEDEDLTYGGDGQGGSYFSAGTLPGSTWSYSNSGKWVNANVFAGLPTSYTACEGTTIQSSSSKTVASSSSRAVVSSSSRATVSSSSKIVVSSSSKTVVSSSSNPFADDDFASSSSKKVSSSSKTTVPSSSSKAVATASEWDSDNANLSDKSETGVIVGKLLEGSKRTITRELTLNKNEDYVVSFRAVTEGEEGTVKIKVTDGDKKLCVDAFDISEKKTTVSCDFTAASKSATLTITISGTNENVTLSKFKLGDGTDAIKVAQKPNFGMSVNNKHLYITANVAASVQVFDVMGNMVLKAFKPANASDVSLENVTDGNYIIRVKSRNGVQAIKASLK